MKVHTLMYHDVTVATEPDASGFPGPDAALYKLDREEFERHLLAIAKNSHGPILATQLFQDAIEPTPFLLTFDDGGRSAYAEVADRLERLGWHGHFFVTANQIGSATFLNRKEIKELHLRGHIIGSHSCSHPVQMSQCSREQLLNEWRTSLEILSDATGERVCIASVPGGYYSRKVAEAASETGIKLLFTSEPTSVARNVDGCTVLGRYAVQRWTSAKSAADLAAGKLPPRLKQMLLWNFKKATKVVGGSFYLKARKILIGRAKPGFH